MLVFVYNSCCYHPVRQIHFWFGWWTGAYMCVKRNSDALHSNHKIKKHPTRNKIACKFGISVWRGMTLKKRVIIASPPCAIILRMLCLELSWKILEVFLSGFRSSYVPFNCHIGVSLEFMRINYKWEVYFLLPWFSIRKTILQTND